MNCKPGDLAVIVGGFHPANLGKIVTVLRAAPYGEVRLPGHLGVYEPSDEPSWIVEGSNLATSFSTGLSQHICRDKVLRPIRDQPGEDKMLRIAGLPNKLTEPA